MWCVFIYADLDPGALVRTNRSISQRPSPGAYQRAASDTRAAVPTPNWTIRADRLIYMFLDAFVGKTDDFSF